MRFGFQTAGPARPFMNKASVMMYFRAKRASPCVGGVEHLLTSSLLRRNGQESIRIAVRNPVRRRVESDRRDKLMLLRMIESGPSIDAIYTCGSYGYRLCILTAKSLKIIFNPG